MKILHCNTYDNGGGAAIAAHRLHTALCGLGVDSHLGVLQREREEVRVHRLVGALRKHLSGLISRAEKMPFKLFGTKFNSFFSSGLFPSFVHRRINGIAADITHLHWIQSEFISLRDIARITTPLVMTLHDTWGFTGGCHILQGCEQYKDSCAACPQVSSGARWLVKKSFNVKQCTYAKKRIDFVLPSKAYLFKARQSRLLQHSALHHIPNPIDTARFSPLETPLARKIMGVSPHIPTLLFGAIAASKDANKGYDLLSAALLKLPQYYANPVQLLVFGASEGVNVIGAYPVQYLGRLHDDVSLRLAYCAADAFVCPSREENFPYTVMESLSCGTPVAAFAVGGIPDMVEDMVNGRLAVPHDTDALARSIAYILEDKERHACMCIAARQVVEERYALSVVARQYLELYSEILERK